MKPAAEVCSWIANERLLTFHKYSFILNIKKIKVPALLHVTWEHTVCVHREESITETLHSEEEQKGRDLPVTSQETPPCGATLHCNSNCYNSLHLGGLHKFLNIWLNTLGYSFLFLNIKLWSQKHKAICSRCASRLNRLLLWNFRQC